MSSILSHGDVPDTLSAPPAKLALREYQHEAVAAVEKAWSEGITRPLLAIATGLGKTIIFAELIRRTGGRALVLAHRDELLEQAREKILFVHPEADIGMVRREEQQIDAQIILASVQTVARERRLQSLPRDFKLVVVDEAHHAVAPYHKKILTHVGCFSEAPEAPLLLGVTATPQRADRVGLTDVFQSIVYKMTVLDGILQGYLVNLRCKQISLDMDLSRAEKKSGDLDEGELGRALMEANAPQHIVAAYCDEARGKKGLAFLPTVDVATATAAAFCAAGIPAEMLSGETPANVRRQMLARLRSGETRILTNCGVLTEGFDEPSIEVILEGRPTYSRTLYTQIIGRVTRLFPGKREGLILDFVGASKMHKLVTLSTITGLPSDILEDKGVLAALEEQAAPSQQEQEETVDGQLVKEKSNLFAELSWVALPRGGYVLSLGTAMLFLQPKADAHYDVILHEKQTVPRCLATDLTLEYAQGVAEDSVRHFKAFTLASSSAGWRQLPASMLQKETLAKFRIEYSDGMTKGRAADLITAHIARDVMSRDERADNRSIRSEKSNG